MIGGSTQQVVWHGPNYDKMQDKIHYFLFPYLVLSLQSITIVTEIRKPFCLPQQLMCYSVEAFK